MKKKILLPLFSLLPTLTILSTKCTNQNIDNNKTVLYSDDKITLPDKNTKSTITNILDCADINIMYAPGVQPFYDLLRLALMSKGETHFYYTPNTSKMPYQKAIVPDELEKFLTEGRKNNFTTNEKLTKELEELQKKSKVYKIEGTDLNRIAWYQIPKLIKKIVESNPDKLINIWCNSYWIKSNDWTNLANYKNVRILGLNDSSAILRNHADAFDKVIKDHIIVTKEKNIYGKEEITYKTKKPSWWSYERYILMPNLYKNIHFFFNDTENVDKLREKGLNVLPYSYQDDYEIKNDLFSARDKNNKRLSVEWWQKVTIFNWKNEANKIRTLRLSNNKKSLIYLGSHETFAPFEKNHILSLLNKYGDQYNIFYKGHPAYAGIENFIYEIQSGKTFSYYDVLEKTQKNYTLPQDVKIEVLFNQIASEEITSDHKDEPEFEKLDKWASVHRHSSAFKKFLLTNTIDDLVLAGDYPEKPGNQYNIITCDDADKNTQAWKEFKQLIGA